MSPWGLAASAFTRVKSWPTPAEMISTLMSGNLPLKALAKASPNSAVSAL